MFATMLIPDAHAGGGYYEEEGGCDGGALCAILAIVAFIALVTR